MPESYVPAGHFYSPLPSDAEIDAFARRQPVLGEVPGVDLREADQLALLAELAPFYPDLPFTDDGAAGFRYRFVNPSYSYADGIFLYSMLRWLEPCRLVEVGSGFTSALTLDVNQHFLAGRLECCFVEPHPELLLSLMTDDDRGRATVIPARVQDVELEVFTNLAAGDILFVDSTHVAKVGSDVNHLFFEVLPRLAPGVLVHVHDVFPAFEYPLTWLREGRAWNEQYLLRAFLQFNQAFRIRLFGSYLVRRHPAWFAEHMPLCLKNPGGALWMERVG